MSILNKETLKEVDLGSMKWEAQTFQQIIIDKKNQAEEEILEFCSKNLIEMIAEGNLTDREIKNFVKELIQDVRQIERMA